MPRPPARRPAPARAPGQAAPPRPNRPSVATPPRTGRPASEPPPRPGRPRSAPAPAGSYWLHGLHAVAAALANPARRPRRLLLTEGGATALALRMPPPWPLGPEPVAAARLDTLLGADAVHQGMALLVDPLVPPPLTEALARPGPVLVLDQVTDPRNVGAILRAAAAFGAACVLVQDRHAPQEGGAMARAAAGAMETVPMLRAVNLARTLVALQQAGLWVVGLDAAAPGTLAAAGLARRRTALVLGAEGDGLRRLTREGCDELARLPIRPAMESLNVAAAAAVALYELARE